MNSIEHSSLPRLRKGLLQAVETLIDSLRPDGVANLVLAQPPLKLPPAVRVTPMPIGLPPEPDPLEHYPYGQRWLDLKLHSISLPYMGCVVEGEADIRIGFPSTVLVNNTVRDTDAEKQAGCCFLTLPAISFLLLPPGVAFASGAQPPWERPNPELARSTMLWVHFPPNEALCHICTMRDSICTSELSVRVKSQQLTQLWELVKVELANSGQERPEIAKTLLLALLLHLRYGLSDASAKVADGMSFWIPAPELAPPRPNFRALKSLEQACEYIQLNLHEPLSPTDIARHAQLSPTHLKRIFRSRLDTTVMGYVTQQRLESAKIYLRKHRMSIAEVSKLVGYPQPAHFSRVFLREVGTSPTEFRQRNREA